jgi:cysteine desulfurase
MSLSAHKFGGPKGVGVLVIRKGVAIDPLLVGGGQERDRRSGTHNVPGIVAMAAALAATDAERQTECARIAAVRDRLVGGLLATVDGVRETIPPDVKVPGGAHVCVEGVESESLLFLLDEAGLCASAASACASGAMEPSHVLAAMGVERNWSDGALRMTLGRTTTDADADRAVDILAGAITTLRARRAPAAQGAH